MERPYYGFYHIKNENDETISSINLDDISYMIPRECDTLGEGTGNSIEKGFNIHFKNNTTQFVTVDENNFKQIVKILANS